MASKTAAQRLACTITCRSLMQPFEAAFCTFKGGTSVSPACERNVIDVAQRGCRRNAGPGSNPTTNRTSYVPTCGALPSSGLSATRNARWKGTAASQTGERSSEITLVTRMQSLASKTAQNLRSAGNKAGQYVPVTVKQLGAAAASGELVRVSSLQAQAFWARFGGYIVAAGFAVLTFYIWKGLHSLTSAVVDVTNRYVSWLLVGAALGVGLVGYLYYRQQWVVSPRQVYNLAMFKLKQDAGVLEVLGAPVAATFPRACIVTAGGLRFRGLKPAWRSERVHMVFPLEGRARTGMVTVHAKKRRGKYSFRQLAVDVPAQDGSVQERVLVAGDSAPAAADDLRAPLLQTLEQRPVFDKEDDEDDARDAVVAKQAAQERKKRREEAAPKPLDMGGGMYFYERAYWQMYYFNKRVKSWMLQWQTRHLGP